MSDRAHVAVIGAGVTGLAAAHALHGEVAVTVFEEQDRTGGKIATAAFRDHRLDTGADAFITRNGAAETLCRELGLGDELLSPSASSVAIFSRGGLRALPRGLNIGIPTDIRALFGSGVVSTLGCLRALLDRISPAAVAPNNYQGLAAEGVFDPSVGELVGRRLGREVLSVLVDPLIGGINASGVSELSFAAALPQLVEKVAGQKCLMKALALPATPTTTATSVPPSSPFRGLRGGMSVLVDRLTSDLQRREVAMLTNTAVKALTFSKGTWIIHSEIGNVDADAVLLAVPSFVASQLLVDVAPELSAELSAIPYAGVATVTMAWPKDVTTHLKTLERPRSAALSRPTLAELFAGAGVLVPRQYGMHLTAASFTSTKWPRSANDDEVVIRSSVGRSADDRWRALSDDELASVVRGELEQLIGLGEEPLDVLVKRFPNALAQYVPGHLGRLSRIDRLVADQETLSVAGASYHGVGIPACVQSGQDAASRLLQRLEP